MLELLVSRDSNLAETLTVVLILNYILAENPLSMPQASSSFDLPSALIMEVLATVTD